MTRLTKQEILDLDTNSNDERVLQNMVQHLSKTRLEAIKRMFNELEKVAIYKTQYKELRWEEIMEALTTAVDCYKNEENVTNE